VPLHPGCDCCRGRRLATASVHISPQLLQPRSTPTGLTGRCVGLNKLNLAYLHVMRADFFGVQRGQTLRRWTSLCTGPLMANMGYTPGGGLPLRTAFLDAVCFQRAYLILLTS
jgi:hypothetical protein